MTTIIKEIFLLEEENVNREVRLLSYENSPVKWRIVIDDYDIDTSKAMPTKCDEFSADISLRRMVEIFKSEYSNESNKRTVS